MPCHNQILWKSCFLICFVVTKRVVNKGVEKKEGNQYAHCRIFVQTKTIKKPKK